MLEGEGRYGAVASVLVVVGRSVYGSVLVGDGLSARAERPDAPHVGVPLEECPCGHRDDVAVDEPFQRLSVYLLRARQENSVLVGVEVAVLAESLRHLEDLEEELLVRGRGGRYGVHPREGDGR